MVKEEEKDEEVEDEKFEKLRTSVRLPWRRKNSWKMYKLFEGGGGKPETG